jgi:hypothetical protein
MIQRTRYKQCQALLAAAPLVLAASSATAYVGPGAGLSLLAALWGVVAAIGIALFFVLAWPVRRLLRARRERQREPVTASTPPHYGRQPHEEISPALAAAHARQQRDAGREQRRLQ